jgi:hypothetical protein
MSKVMPKCPKCGRKLQHARLEMATKEGLPTTVTLTPCGCKAPKGDDKFDAFLAIHRHLEGAAGG